MGTDLSSFGGPILPGATEGNSMILKVFKVSDQTEYNVTYNKDVKYKLSGTFSGEGVDLEDDSSILFTENMEIQCKRK